MESDKYFIADLRKDSDYRQYNLYLIYKEKYGIDTTELDGEIWRLIDRAHDREESSYFNLKDLFIEACVNKKVNFDHEKVFNILIKKFKIPKPKTAK